ncbi:MAG: hypothetical protein LBP53_08145 [Candidatus Peribacteria bacterium]|jgi:hypothetical protein|nr:hypothetical protein [Candidatus Peribacteria bacterium]
MEKIIENLYQNYGKTKDEELCTILKNITLLQFNKKQEGNGYYSVKKEIIEEKLLKKPRGYSFNFDLEPDTTNKIDLSGYKSEKIFFLIKSTSCFHVKADFGEVIDQMSEEQKQKVKFLCVDLDYHEAIPNTEGEHFIGRAYLFS